MSATRSINIDENGGITEISVVLRSLPVGAITVGDFTGGSPLTVNLVTGPVGNLAPASKFTSIYK